MKPCLSLDFSSLATRRPALASSFDLRTHIGTTYRSARERQIQRFRGPLHRRNSVRRWNRICRKSSGSFCKSIRLAARSTDRSGCETAQIFSSWDSWDNTGIRVPPNYSPEPTSGFFLTPMLARIWRRGDYIARVCTTLLVSVTSLVIPVFSVLYGRVSAVASVSAMPPRLSYGHQKCPNKVT